MKPPKPKMNQIPDKVVVKDEYSKTGKTEKDPRPQFSVNAEEFPDIKEWSVGKKYKMEIEAEMVSSSIGDWGDDKGKLVCSFKISGIATDNDSDEERESDNSSKYPSGMVKKSEKK